MKEYKIIFNKDGMIEASTKSFAVDGDKNVVKVIPEFPSGFKGNRVRAYVSAATGASDVIDLTDGALILSDEYVAAGTTAITFEIIMSALQNPPADAPYFRFEKFLLDVNPSVKVDKSKPANTYSVTVAVADTITSEPGTPASVENTGNAKDVNLLFTIPQGEKGDPGSKGDKGDTGPKGDKGDTGPKGNGVYYSLPAGTTIDTLDTEGVYFLGGSTYIVAYNGSDICTQYRFDEYGNVNWRFAIGGGFGDWQALNTVEIHRSINLEIDEAGFCSLPLESGSTSIYHLSNDPLMSNGIIHFVLPTPAVTDVFYQILIHANLTVDGGIFWGTSTFFNGEVPDIGTGTYDLIFEWDGTEWCAGAIAKGVVE